MKIVPFLRKNYSLIPLIAGTGLALCGAIFSLFHASKDPEVSFKKRQNLEPWNEYADKQFKLYSPTMDYSEVKSQAPTY